MRVTVKSSLYTGVLLSAAPVLASVMVHSSAELRYDLGEKRWPVWSRGALIAIEQENTAAAVLRLFDGTGAEMQTLQLAIPGAVRISVYDVSRAPNGAVVLCGYAMDAQGRAAAFIASSGGNGWNIVRTPPYVARHITVASDGTVWTQGVETRTLAQRPPTSRDFLNPAAGIIRRFDAGLRPLASFIPQSTVAAMIDISASDSNYLAACRDRVAWYSTRANRYVEFSLDGRAHEMRVDALPGGAVHASFAITDDGRTLISVSNAATHALTLYALKRATGAWQPLAATDSSPAFSGLLYGVEGNLLVMARPHDRFGLMMLEVN